MDEKKKVKLKRIFAWIYLVLFIFVILNLMIFDFYKDIFLFAYIALILVYFIVFKNVTETNKTTNEINSKDIDHQKEREAGLNDNKDDN
ncbi:MAG: hypothetical protein PHV04_03110 [Clostridia bacterium]|jgi:c-di-AMP phosphodiesterase-like protein|nr:hypothetical protein [Clostridia bacterium]MDD3093094.1 hypothetical protein [Clostridia bacterium]